MDLMQTVYFSKSMARELPKLLSIKTGRLTPVCVNGALLISIAAVVLTDRAIELRNTQGYRLDTILAFEVNFTYK